MEKILENSLLFDFYGELLTEKQKEIYKLYVEDDLSLSEISDELNITRQSIHDSLKHTKKTLEEYEEKLGLVKKFLKQKEEIKTIIKMLDEIDDCRIDVIKDKLLRASQ